MDTTRWETEALRSGRSGRPGPPKPSGQRRRSTANWVTLREAESATGIPVNTLRKWVRRSDIPSYLESDGDIALRMVDLDAVERRAVELGRDIAPIDPAPSHSSTEPPSVPLRAERQPSQAVDEPPSSPHPVSAEERSAPDTMIVPIDAWNKMLSQLGNLHEAGQQLAEARERAAKAETEAAFLRSRLAELRSEGNDSPTGVTIETPMPAPPPDAEDPPAATTTYWRILRANIRRRTGRD